MKFRGTDKSILRACLVLGSTAPSLMGNGYDGSAAEVHFLGYVTIENAAVLDASGKPYHSLVGGGSGISYHSALHDLLADTYIENKHKFIFKTDSSSEGKYRKAIQEFTRFPFGYYALALALRYHRDPGWRDFAETAVSILERTTAIPGCNENHFDALKELKGYLAESGP